MSHKNRVNKICELCGKHYEVPKSHDKRNKFCSNECRKKRNPPDTKQCLWCNKEFITYQRVQKFCNKKCASQYQSKYYVGVKSNGYKDGKSLERDRAREGTKLKEWRKEVFKKDGYTCQMCESKTDLQAHHIKSWSEFKEYRFDIFNGLTLCINCHGKIHNRDFTKRYNRKCRDCGKKVRDINGLCHSCSSKRQWQKRKLLQN